MIRNVQLHIWLMSITCTHFTIDVTAVHFEMKRNEEKKNGHETKKSYILFQRSHKDPLMKYEIQTGRRHMLNYLINTLVS